MEPNKVVVRFLDGRVVKGFTQNFFPNKPTFHIRPIDAKGPTDTVEIALDDLKAVFFVRDFSGNSQYKEIKKITPENKPQARTLEVTCKDGEIILGSTTGYDPKRPGFFLFPIDTNWNNLKAYITSKAVKSVRFL